MSFIRFACRCAAKTKEAGLEYFGLQNYAECWSGNGDYSNYGRQNSKCLFKLNGKPKDRRCDDSNDDVCFGTGVTNYVYQLAEGRIIKRVTLFV